MSRVIVGEFPSAAPIAESRAPTGRAWRGRISILMLTAFLAAILAFGWLHRDDEAFNPQHGIGYALGIAGGTMMLLVLLYPLRKRLKFMRSWAKLAPWFRWHMVLGCLGPVLVLVHARFEALSLNGFMALAATLIVAASGVIGRYLYVRIHRGLYGAKLEAKEILNEAVGIRLSTDGTTAPLWRDWEGDLKKLEQQALTHPPSLWAALKRTMTLNAAMKRAKRKILTEHSTRLGAAIGSVRQAAGSKAHAELRKGLARYFGSLRRAGSLAFYERLFALWHVLHLPLIVLLVFTAIIHVIAVHMY